MKFIDIENKHVLVIEDFFDEEQITSIKKEIAYLECDNKLLDPTFTGTAKENNNKPRKNNMGLFLDSVYADRNFSAILKHTSDIFNEDITSKYESMDIMNRYLRMSDSDNTLLSQYKPDGFYKPHADTSTITAVFWLKEGDIQGGDLFFHDFNIRIPFKENRVVIFPSIFIHSVNLVQGTGKRYCIAKFIGNK
tara:strand:- start:164 stop:742 length:579 start_codon:yes stop_codon:yes gene_type:complete